MQITTNYSIPKTQAGAAPQKKRNSAAQVNFGKVTGEKELLLPSIGMRRMDIIDKISDEAGLDVFIKRGVDFDGSTRRHGYIIPNSHDNPEPDPKDYNTRVGIGWWVPRGQRTPDIDAPKPPGGMFVLKDSRAVLSSGEGFLYSEHPMSLYMIIMRDLCQKAAERKIMSALQGREVDFNNQKDAYDSTFLNVKLPLYTFPQFTKAFSPTKSENRRNHDNLLNASADTFTRVIDRMADLEVWLQNKNNFKTRKAREHWVSQNRSKFYPLELFNDKQWEWAEKYYPLELFNDKQWAEKTQAISGSKKRK